MTASRREREGDPLKLESTSRHRECLLRFRAEHQSKHLATGGVEWEYFACGSGADRLLFLPGGLRIAEHAFLYLQMFEETYRVIAPTYPPLRSIDEVCAGLEAILEAEGVQQALVLGQSYGGLVAQVFAQRCPGRVKKLVLSSAGPLVASPAQKRALAFVLRLLQLSPERVAKGLFKQILRLVLSVPAAERPFWKSYLDELFAQRLSKAHVLSHFRTSLDTLEKYAFENTPNPPWPGPVLIVGGERDPASTEADRQVMAAYYSHAEVHVLPGAGHTAAWEQPEAYARVVRGF